MELIVPLNFPPAQLDLNRKSGKVFVKCLIRRREILLTPEEWVRQHLIAYLINTLNYPQTLIGVEKSIQYNGLSKRWDLVVFNSDFEPYILVECKSPSIKLGTNTLQQALSYQHQLNCEIIVISNGLETYTWRLNRENQSLDELKGIPGR